MADTMDQGTSDSKTIGRQITLPLSKAFSIAWAGIRIRLWRSLITMSGIILAIAFLTSVWTAGVFSERMKSVGPDEEHYALVQGVLEAEAIASSNVKIDCKIIESEDVPAVTGKITPGVSLATIIKGQGVLKGITVPADADEIIGMLSRDRSEAWPDALIFVGFPAALGQPEVAEAVARYMRAGKFVLVYGTWGIDGLTGDETPATIWDIMPAAPTGGEVIQVSGPDLERGKDSVLTGVLWRDHPSAGFLPAEAQPGGVSLVESGQKPVAWWRDVGKGAVAWYPASKEDGAAPALLSWFGRGYVSGESETTSDKTSLMTRLITHGSRAKLRGEGYDTRGLWLVTLSLLVCVVGITNAMLMSVTERFREIGTMKCLGALDSFIVKLFLIESSMQGVFGSLAGAAIGFVLAFGRALLTFHVQDLQTGNSYWLALTFFPGWSLVGRILIAVGTGILLSVVAAVYPATRAARMQPVQAMRAEA